jgi:hypothetical protein
LALASSKMWEFLSNLLGLVSTLISRRRTTQSETTAPAPEPEPVDDDAARAGTVSGAAAWEASRHAGPGTCSAAASPSQSDIPATTLVSASDAAGISRK